MKSLSMKQIHFKTYFITQFIPVVQWSLWPVCWDQPTGWSNADFMWHQNSSASSCRTNFILKNYIFIKQTNLSICISNLDLNLLCLFKSVEEIKSYFWIIISQSETTSYDLIDCSNSHRWYTHPVYHFHMHPLTELVVIDTLLHFSEEVTGQCSRTCQSFHKVVFPIGILVLNCFKQNGVNYKCANKMILFIRLD